MLEASGSCRSRSLQPRGQAGRQAGRQGRGGRKEAGELAARGRGAGAGAGVAEHAAKACSCGRPFFVAPATKPLLGRPGRTYAVPEAGAAQARPPEQRDARLEQRQHLVPKVEALLQGVDVEDHHAGCEWEGVRGGGGRGVRERAQHPGRAGAGHGRALSGTGRARGIWARGSARDQRQRGRNRRVAPRRHAPWPECGVRQDKFKKARTGAAPRQRDVGDDAGQGEGGGHVALSLHALRCTRAGGAGAAARLARRRRMRNACTRACVDWRLAGRASARCSARPPSLLAGSASTAPGGSATAPGSRAAGAAHLCLWGSRAGRG